MQKIFLPILLAITFTANAQQRLFDQPVQLKSCNISIEANSFIATTVIEMEFYNSKDQEVEAYQGFQLHRGQVITDFQLELNGKYREGSIEEKRKANNAYRTIVGKRIDPAILQMNGNNNYTLNIYPVAARSSRKIKFTITQLMEESGSKLVYNLPLRFPGNTDHFKLKIKIKNPATIPYGNKGFLENRLFDMGLDAAALLWQAKDIILNQAISFSINQFTDQPQVCISKKNGSSHFVMRVYNSNVPVHYAASPWAINVYWDVSMSGKGRNLGKELDFLERYISSNEITKARITLFNQQVQGIIVFDRSKDNFDRIRGFLLGYKYSGSTELRNLNFSDVLCDAILVFSDGINSIGTVRPRLGTVPVSCIVSSNHNSQNLSAITGTTGGAVINLHNTPVKDAVKKIDSAENFLFRYSGNNIRINEQFPVKLGKSILLSGIVDAPGTLELVYGNNSKVHSSTDHFLSPDQNCGDDDLYKKIQMLKDYDSLMYSNNGYYDWQDMVIFGLNEKVVTPQTSYLVLERIEDYIKYNIAPPKELVEKCAELSYVYRPAYKISALKAITEQEALQAIVNSYNQRISWWDKNEASIDLKRKAPESKNNDIASNPASEQQNKKVITSTSVETNFMQGTSDLKEVVVSGGYGIKRNLRSVTTNVQVVSAEELNTIRNTNINEALAGKVAGIQVRGQSGAKLGSIGSIRLHGVNSLSGTTGLLYVLDGTRVDADDINVDDVEDVTLLRGPAAAAIFGPDGANGALVVTSKKARRTYSYPVWGEYKLSSTEDEDYIQQVKKAAGYELWDVYLELEKEYDNDIGFYFEMADFFFEKQKSDRAHELMFNAIELCNGRVEGLKLAAYIYEKWGSFKKAIAIYEGILSMNANNLPVKRDLALAYFQDKNYETAVKTYYSILTAPVTEKEYINVRENALAEMNAVIAAHKNEFDISYININLVKVLPVDLRITVEGNYYGMDNVQFIEPGNTVCNPANKNTVNGGRLMADNNYWHDRSIDEYAIKNALPGRYRIKVNAHNYRSYAGTIPMVARVIVFKNFQKNNMEIEVKNFNLDNQYGIIELDEVKW